jgi:hypothetical protein
LNRVAAIHRSIAFFAGRELVPKVFRLDVFGLSVAVDDDGPALPLVADHRLVDPFLEGPIDEMALLHEDAMNVDQKLGLHSPALTCTIRPDGPHLGRNIKVTDLDANSRQHDVAGFDVPVNHARIVRMHESVDQFPWQWL